MSPDSGLRRIWTAQVPGYTAHRVFPDVHPGAVYTSDGWGVTYGALSLRAWSLDDGHLLARAPRVSARCMVRFPDNGDLLVADDVRLRRLDAETLKEVARWDRRIPRYSDHIALRGSTVALANWLGAGVSFVDLDDGKVRRRSGSELQQFVGDPASTHLVGLLHGGVSRVTFVPPGLTPVIDAGPAVDGAGAGDRVVLLEGKPYVRLTDRSIDHREVRSASLRMYDTTSGAAIGSLQLPKPVSSLRFGPSGLWGFGGRDLLRITDGTWAVGIRDWTAPVGHVWMGTDLAGRVGLAIHERNDRDNVADLSAFSLDGAP